MKKIRLLRAFQCQLQEESGKKITWLMSNPLLQIMLTYPRSVSNGVLSFLRSILILILFTPNSKPWQPLLSLIISQLEFSLSSALKMELRTWRAMYNTLKKKTKFASLHRSFINSFTAQISEVIGLLLVQFTKDEASI